jgi:hypothetical protein
MPEHLLAFKEKTGYRSFQHPFSIVGGIVNEDGFLGLVQNGSDSYCPSHSEKAI